MKKPPDKSDPHGFFDAYAEFARTLRTWLVAYGIGGPVLFITNDTAFTRLRSSGYMGFIGLCFLLGVALQVFGALMNKITMWTIYFGEDNEAFRQRRLYKLFDRLSECILIDLLWDVGSIVLFSWATVLTFRTLCRTT